MPMGSPHFYPIWNLRSRRDPYRKMVETLVVIDLESPVYYRDVSVTQGISDPEEQVIYSG